MTKRLISVQTFETTYGSLRSTHEVGVINAPGTRYHQLAYDWQMYTKGATSFYFRVMTPNTGKEVLFSAESGSDKSIIVGGKTLSETSDLKKFYLETVEKMLDAAVEMTETPAD